VNLIGENLGDGGGENGRYQRKLSPLLVRSSDGNSMISPQIFSFNLRIYFSSLLWKIVMTGKIGQGEYDLLRWQEKRQINLLLKLQSRRGFNR